MVPDFLTIAAAARLIEQRELSPVELVDSRLARIEKLDGQLHSFIRVLADQARADARAAEAEIAADRYRGSLHGIPIGLKDIYETAGVATTGHSKVMQDHVPRADAFSVAGLRDAGAIVMGKLATHEFAFGGPSFDLPWPPARNPWDLSRFTGGSSSGTGAEGAAGLVLGGTGTAARRLGGLRRRDHAVRGLRDPRREPAPPLHRLRRDVSQPHGVGGADHRGRLRAGAAPPPRIDRRTRPGDGKPGPPADRRRPDR